MEKEELKEIADLAKIDTEKLTIIRELTEISVLYDIKQKIVRWAQNWAILITVAFSVLAIFGIDQLVLNRVDTEVKEKLNNMNKVLFDAEQKLLRKSKQYDTIIKEANSLIYKTKLVRDELDHLQKSVNQTWKNLSEINQDGQLIIVLRKLVNEFFTIKNIEILVKIYFTEDVNKLAANLGFRTHHFALGIDLQVSLNSDASRAQFYYPGRRSLTYFANPVTKITEAITYRTTMYGPFEEKYYGKHMNEFKFQAIRFRSSSLNLKRAEALTKALSKITTIECTIYINQVPVLAKTFKHLKFKAKNDLIGDNHHAAAIQEFQEGGRDMKKTYEGVFLNR